MPIDFNQYLTPEQKRSILEQRLAQFAAEAFQHDINRKVAEQAGDTNLVAASEQALTVLEQAMTVHEQEMANLANNQH